MPLKLRQTFIKAEWGAEGVINGAVYAWRRFTLMFLVQLAAYQRVSVVTEIDLTIAESGGFTSVEEKQRNCTHPRSDRTGKGSNAFAKRVSCGRCGLLLF